MNKFRKTGKGKSGEPTRQNTGISVKKENISAPIPLTEDDEFPIRTPGTGIATPLGEPHERKVRPPTESSLPELEGSPHQSGHAISSFREPVVDNQPRSSPSPWPSEVAAQPASQPGKPRMSMGSIPSGLSVEKPQRKKSSLRSVLGRLFGKKRKGSASPQSRQKESKDFAASQHRSDPTALNRNTTPKSSSQQRSTSLPINEFNRALRSHSVLIDDFPLRESSYEPNRESIQADGTTRPRRSTNPGNAWHANKPAGYMDWTGLSPRPASVHARGSRLITDDEADQAVGVAVSSGSHPNRRSRSLGEFRGRLPPGVTRRRSDEIRYWRESYDPGVFSPLSSNKADFEDEPILVDSPELAAEKEAYEQPQPFNFGQLGELAGMRITQAVSLETRVGQLEDRMLKVERSYHNTPQGDQLPKPPLRNPSRNTSAQILRPTTDDSDVSLPKHQFLQSSPPRPTRQESQLQGSQIRSSSYGSSRPSTMSNNTCPPSFEKISSHIHSGDINKGLSPKPARPLSTSTTIRGIPLSSPTDPKDRAITNERYTTLNNMIIAEQTARQNLEAIVLNLQRQLHAVLSATPPLRHSQNVTTGDRSSFEANDSDDDNDANLTEDFRTPKEERGHFEDEIFGAPAIESKSAPRTLSLSQMTIAKSIQ